MVNKCITGKVNVCICKANISVPEHRIDELLLIHKINIVTKIAKEHFCLVMRREHYWCLFRFNVLWRLTTRLKRIQINVPQIVVE